MDRRRLLGLAMAASAAPPAAAAPAAAALGAYFRRLRRLLEADGGPQFLPWVEDGLAEPHNELRRRGGLAPLARRPDLDGAARAHAADLLERRFFAHASPEGFEARHRVGLLCRAYLGVCGENIAEIDGAAASGAKTLLALWRDSPPHLANIRRPSFAAVGFGVARDGDRVAAAAVFGDAYGDLAPPLPLVFEGGLTASRALAGAGRPFLGYVFSPLGGGAGEGPWPLGRPCAKLPAGAWRLDAYAPDADVAGRALIVPGPIVFSA
jgi:uncharacterized protein YkwD